MFGGDGNDILLAGLLTGGNVTKANLPNLPREIHFKNESTKRETFGSYGNMDIDGGAGNDFIIGSVGSDDIFGGAGDDVIYGSQPFRGTNLHGTPNAQSTQHTAAAPQWCGGSARWGCGGRGYSW